MSRPAYLTTLLETGSIAHSALPHLILSELQALELVATESHKSRRRIVITDLDAFADWLDARYPPDPSDLSTLLSRAQNVARTRSSKSGATTHGVQPVLLKWFGPHHLEPARLTTRYGLVAAASNQVANLPWPTVWGLLLVENWESFHSLDYSLAGSPIVAVYLGGFTPDVTLQALGTVTPPPSRSLCFVDYDWTGLRIFTRIRRYLPAVDLYLPPDLDTLFAQYSRHDLATAQPPFLDDDPNARRVIGLIQQYNAGLEQEIVSSPSYTAFDE